MTDPDDPRDGDDWGDEPRSWPDHHVWSLARRGNPDAAHELDLRRKEHQ